MPAGKDGFCPVRAGLFPSYNCRAWCWHDGECPHEEKCCLRGCDYVCPQIPRCKPCWDPRRRRGSQCLDDSVCRREEKCCDTGCGWECVAVPRGRGHSLFGGSCGDKADGRCVEECQADSHCPRGQRCTSIGCGHVCMDIPGGRVGVCPIPRDAGTCLDLCNFDEECPWGHKCCSNGCGHVCTPASLQGQPLTPTHPSWPVPSPPPPAIKLCLSASSCPIWSWSGLEIT
uniref:WAP domain-containing protein n=1 Tax=Catharus ustulatus TaxID=91951 RepID=A0A8C3U6Q1_CATUS